jgi:pyruvate kinase
VRKTKIVATIGPSTDSEEMIEKLILAGVNVFRFNFSHSTHEYHGDNLVKVRKIATKLAMPIAILQDISGPKIRVGEINGVMCLNAGDILSFYDKAGFDDKYGVTINHPHILPSLKQGDLIYLADGGIRCEVTANVNGVVRTKILVGGDLTSKKGVNFPNASLPIAAITEKDIKDMEFGVKIGVDMMAVSFIKSREDIEEAKRIVAGFGGDCPIFAKIEKAEAVENLSSIVEVADGLMVARGDLGVELGLSKVPIAQKKIIRTANRKGIPVITATQMLTSMIDSPFPTRAEVSDIANAVLDGTDAVMLSDETTVGKYPIEAIKVLDEAITEVETIYPFYRNLDKIHNPADAIAVAANRMAEDMEPNALIVFTRSGGSAKTVAKYRPKPDILVSVHCEQAYRRLAIVWGVRPVFILEEHESSDRMLCEFTMKALDEGVMQEDGTYIVTVGYPTGLEGTTNLVRIMRAADIEHAKSVCNI